VSWPPLFAATVLALNDHVLKVEFASWWTGKLSDVAGLFYFPLFLTASVRLLIGIMRWALPPKRPFVVPPLRRMHLAMAALLTGAVFVAINTSPITMGRYNAVLSLVVPSRGTVDTTDLLALPALVLSYWWGQRFVIDGTQRAPANPS